MNLEPRQQYGLGSFVKKAVKGVTGAVKKVAGSDLGKAALTIGLGMYAGGLGPFAQGSTMFGGKLAGLKGAGFLKNLPAITGGDGILKGITENFPGGGMGLAATAAGLTGFMSAQGVSDEQIEEIKQNPEALKGYLDQYYRNLNPPTADTNSEEYEAQVSNFVQRNLKADGGRIGFGEGANKEYKFMELIDTEGEEEYYRKRAEELDRKYNPQNYNDIIPKEKPIQKYLLNEVMSKRGINTLSEDTREMFIKELAVKAFKKGQISREEYNEIMGMEAKKANGGRIGFEDGTYFDEQTTNITGKETTGPMPGGKTPQIPGEEFFKYQQFKENKVVPASSDSKPEYGTKEYFKQNLDSLNLEQLVEKPFLLNPFSIGLIEERLNSFEKVGGDSSRYRNLYEKIKEENTKYFQSLSEAEQKAYVDRHRKSLEKDIGLGILPGQEELGILDLKKEEGIPQPKKDPFDTEGFKQYRMDAATGGRIGFAFGNPEQNAMEASGIGGLPLNQNPAGITELDLRDSGGFIPPVGVKEKADDIPAMLSNNEFVFTADAVRGMGNGDVNVGAQRMYDMMKKLEGGGRV